MHFLSTYEHAIDSKNRLAIPAEVRASTNGQGWVAGPGPNGLLTLWPSKVFDDMLAPYSKDVLADPAIAQWRTMMYRQSARLELDSAGRVRLPERLLKLFGLSSNVVLLGAGDSLEVIDAAEWHATQELTRTDIAATWKEASRARQRAQASAGEGT